MALEDTCRAPEMVCKEYNRHTLRPNGLLEVEDTSVLEVAPLNIIYAPPASRPRIVKLSFSQNMLQVLDCTIFGLIQ